MTAKYFSRHPLDRWLAAAVVVGVFFASWYRHATFRSGTYDLAVFEQVVWKMAHGHGATSSLTAWNTFGDHLSPILLVFVPLYKIAATPLWFFAAQALALGAGVLCVRPLAEAVGLTDRPRATNALVVLAACNPAVWNAALFDFHPTTLAVPFIMIGCVAALTHRYRDLWLVFVVLIVLRDDLALVAPALAAIGWTTADGRGRRIRVALVGAGLAWTVIGAQIATAMGVSRHFEARYGYLGTSFLDAATQPVHAGVGLLQHLFIGANATLVIFMLIPFLFLPLLRPGWFALAIFVSLPVMVADDPQFHSYVFHYGAPVAPFLVLATAGALVHLRAPVLTRAVGVSIPTAVLALCLMGPPGTEALTITTVKPADAQKALALLHPDDVVSASGLFGAHVADRVTVLPFPFPFVDGHQSFPLDPRVTSTAQPVRDSVDAVILKKPSPGDDREFLNEFLALPDASRFTRTDIGTVVLFRRK